MEKIENFFADSYSEIVIRRCEAHGLFINFHTDVSFKTLQLCLNYENEYEGGRLIYASKDSLIQASRKRGTMTVHDNKIAHGVTALRSRYSLFLLKRRDEIIFFNTSWLCF